MSDCVIGERQHEAHHGLLCENHYERLRQMLADLEDEAAVLSAVPSMQQRSGNRSGSLASERAPARLDVLVHNDPRHGTGKSEDEDEELAAGETLSILGTLHSWARVVREDRQLSAPDRVTVSSERDLLDRQLPWIAEQLWVDEAYGDVRNLLGQLRIANGTARPRPIAHCPHCEDGNVWRSNMWRTVWRVGPDRCERQNIAAPDGPAYCDTCGERWEDVKHLELAEELRRRPHTEDGRPMRTADEIMRDTGLTRSAFDVRAHRLRKAGVGGQSKGGYYDPADFGTASLRSVI